jgi:hypothetical protein
MKKIIFGIIISLISTFTYAQYINPDIPMYMRAPIITEYKSSSSNGLIPYLFAGNVYLENTTAPPNTLVVVGAQLNAQAMKNTSQIVFGIATEAWAHEGSNSILVGVESTPINREPNNPWAKTAFWATFKNRGDNEYTNLSYPPSNLNSAALRIDSIPGTGFESAIVISDNSLMDSNKQKASILNLKNMSMEKIKQLDLIIFPDGCKLRYLGNGQLTTIC